MHTEVGDRSRPRLKMKQCADLVDERDVSPIDVEGQ